MARQSLGSGVAKTGEASTKDTRAFIVGNLRLEPVPSLLGILLYVAHPGSGLSCLGTGKPNDPPPYWAYGWAGGTVLAHHILGHPDIVRGRRVLDLGAGSGVVAISAAKCGAAGVTAADIDENAIAAIALNAEANCVAVETLHGDLLLGPPPAVDVMLVGDLFYDQALADRVLPFLAACRAAGIDVLVGDPRRAALPESRLRLIAEHMVPDFGNAQGNRTVLGGVFTLDPAG